MFCIFVRCRGSRQRIIGLSIWSSVGISSWCCLVVSYRYFNLPGPHGEHGMNPHRHRNLRSHENSCFRATWPHQMSLACTRLGDAPSRHHTPCTVCGRVKTAWRWSWNRTRRLRVCWRPRQASLSSAPVSRHGTPMWVAHQAFQNRKFSSFLWC
jgi:hypothetical protein